MVTKPDFFKWFISPYDVIGTLRLLYMFYDRLFNLLNSIKPETVYEGWWMWEERECQFALHSRQTRGQRTLAHARQK